MKQLTIYDQIIGRQMQEGIIVGIKTIGDDYYAMVHHCFEEAKPSPFHNNKYIYTKLWVL